MDQKIFFAILALGPILVACDQPQTSQDDVAPKRIGQPVAESITDVEVDAPLANVAAIRTRSANAIEPDFTPPELTQEAERSVKGARKVLISFARAIEQKQYEQAWALLSPADKRKWSRTAFANIFADLGKSTVAIPGGTTEGGAGSIYYTAPVTITGSDKDGRPVRLEGRAVLRRVTGVDGATRLQLRWHFDTLTLDWMH